MKPTELVHKLLLNATDLEICKELITEDATYVSLNYENPDLKAVNAQVLQQVLMQLDKAFTNIGARGFGFPRFKK